MDFLQINQYEGRKKLKYRYYQTPDGEEYFRKLWWLVKPSIDYGLFFGITDVMIFTKPNGWLPLLDRFTRVAIRPIFTAVLFESSVYIATNVRKKDDGFNHVIGGMVCGYYWSKFIGYYPMSVPLTVIACVALYNFKAQKMKGTQLVYDEYQIEADVERSAWSRFNTWSSVPKHPRPWLTAEEAAQRGIQP